MFLRFVNVCTRADSHRHRAPGGHRGQRNVSLSTSAVQLGFATPAGCDTNNHVQLCAGACAGPFLALDLFTAGRLFTGRDAGRRRGGGLAQDINGASAGGWLRPSWTRGCGGRREGRGGAR